MSYNNHNFLKLNYNFSRSVNHKINIQKLTAFLLTNKGVKNARGKYKLYSGIENIK